MINNIVPANENGLKWIKMDSDFQKYGFMNVKMNLFLIVNAFLFIYKNYIKQMSMTLQS